MLTPTSPQRLADARPLASARNWRMHAELLRDGAEAPVLTTGQRTVLLRDAEAAERQASRRLHALRRRCPGPYGWTEQDTSRSCSAKLPQRGAPPSAYCNRNDGAPH